METQKLNISIIILSYNTRKLLEECLGSLQLSIIHYLPRSGIPLRGTLSIEVIVVDNNSTDGSVQMLKDLQAKRPEIKTIFNKKNLGFGAANNQALRQAQGEYILLLNSDTVVKDSAPLKMAEFLEKHPKVGAVGCKLLNHDGSSQPSAGLFPSLGITFIMLFFEHWFSSVARASFADNKEVDWVMGAAMMIRKEVIQKAGLMDEGIFMYMDEVEWCYRIKKAGFKVMFFPEAEIIHLFGGSSKSGRKDPILNIYRGLLYFYQKHYSPYQLFILKIMLKLKATGALILGFLTNNQYLKETYVQALEIARS